MEENFRDCKTEDNTKYDGERDFERLKSLGREARVVTDDQIICGIIGICLPIVLFRYLGGGLAL